MFACLEELSEKQDVTTELVRFRLLPLLKGNQFFIDWFLQCIGLDKSGSSKDNESLDNDAGSNETVSYQNHSELKPVVGADEIENKNVDENQHQQNVSPQVAKAEEKSYFNDENEAPASFLANEISAAAASEHTLCDNVLTRSHSIRLNSVSNTSFNKLKPPDQ